MNTQHTNPNTLLEGDQVQVLDCNVNHARRKLLRQALVGAVAVSLPAISLLGHSQTLSQPQQELLNLLKLETSMPDDYEGPSERFLEAINQHYQGATLNEGRVHLTMPSLAENGNSVLLNVEVDSAMTEQSYVKDIRVFAENNPLAEVAFYSFTPASGKAKLTTRMRLSGSQIITAVATMNDGSHWVASSFTTVTLPACVEAFI